MIPKLEALKRLLLKDWDPAGVGDAEGAQDEYDHHAFNVFAMLGQGAGIEEIAAYLNWLESDHMSLPLRAERNRTIATRAVALFTPDEAP